MDRLQFANKFFFITELQRALTLYFSDKRYSNYVTFYSYGGISIYDYKLAVMMVRDHHPDPSRNVFLVLTRKEHALSKECGLFTSRAKAIEGTDFYAERVEIPDDIKPVPPREHNPNLTPGMRNFLSGLFNPKEENPEMSMASLEYSLQEDQKWLNHEFNVRIVFEVLP